MNFLTLTCFVFLTFTFVKNSYDCNNELVGYHEGLGTTLSERLVYSQQVTQFNQKESQDHQSFIPAYYPFSINLNNDLIQHDKQQIPSFDELNETVNGSKPRLYQRKSSRNLQYLTNTTPKKSESTYTTSEDLGSKDTTEKILSQDICHTYVHKPELHTDDKENVALQKALFSQELEKNQTTLNVYAEEFLPRGSANLKYDDKPPKECNKNFKRNQSTYFQSGLQTPKTQLLSPSYIMTTIDSPHIASNLGRENYKYSTTDDKFCNHGISLDSQETSDLVERIDKLSPLRINPKQIDLHSVPKKRIKNGCLKISSISSQCVRNKAEQQSNGNKSSKEHFNKNTKKQNNIQQVNPDTEIQNPIYSKPFFKVKEPINFFFKIISRQLKYASNDIPSAEAILNIISIIDDGSLDFFNRVLFIILLSYTQKGFKNYRDSITQEKIIDLLTNCDKKVLYSTLSIKNAMLMFKELNLRYYSIKEGYDILVKNFTQLYFKKNFSNSRKHLLGFKRHSFFCLSFIFDSRNSFDLKFY
ncbi:hypothetical protein TUBRATIS_28390 [Tubulinosema ratisbonensis]|uniref:Uncharacterized protein n=1 Tax=Tubulinosema ratisbonensis TaxID=291195 RepID=A0A437AI26_9MICR|nr:hypothetical protein TUBRATIS_28390 [Tubulinosema ratisbonensis]